MSAWILLRGLTRESRHWGDFPAVLQAPLGDVKVIALDLPGNGSLHEQRSPACVEAMAEYCRTELTRREIEGPYNIIAMSLGAMAAAAWAARYPTELARCVLINTSLRPFNPFHQRLRPANYGALLKLAVLGSSAEAWEETILRITSNAYAENASVLPEWVRYRQQCPVSRPNALRQLIAAARYRAPATKPAADMLVLTSARDALVDTRCSQTLAARWDVPVRIHPTAGHDIPLDDGIWVARQIREWLENGSADIAEM